MLIDAHGINWMFNCMTGKAERGPTAPKS
jgi:hypothetical protein